MQLLGEGDSTLEAEAEEAVITFGHNIFFNRLIKKEHRDNPDALRYEIYLDTLIHDIVFIYDFLKEYRW